MRQFMISLLVSVLSVGVLGAAAVALLDGDSSTAVTAVGAQVEDGEAGQTTGGLLTDPVQLPPNPAVALLENLRPTTLVPGIVSAQRVILSRDPLQPIFVDPVVGGEQPGDGGGGDPSDPTQPTDPGSPTDPAGESDRCAGDETEAVCEGVVVTLDAFADDGAAIVTVDGVQYTVRVEEEFADSFRLLAINDPCATLLYGDEAFSVCVGATVLK